MNWRVAPRAFAAWPRRCRQTINRSLCRFDRVADVRLRQLARPLCVELERAHPALAALSTDIEQRFLACGNALHEQVKLTGRLQEQSRKLNQFGAESAGGEAAVRRIGETIATHLSLSDDFAREVQRLATTLSRYGDHLQQLLSDQQRLERAFAPMGVLHSFFRIESATLPAELQSLFHAVTTEMRRLHGEVSASFSANGAALGATRKQVLAAAEQLHVQSAQHLELTATRRADVQRSLADLGAKFERTRQRNRELESAITGLDRETDKITVSLQYQDITRQKMEHVQEAAHKVLAQFRRPDGTPLRERVRLQRVLCQVQAVQLDSVQEELQQATDSISSGLRGLLDHLNRIESECLSVTGLNEITAEMDAAVAAMSDIHRVTAELMQASLTRLADAIQIARGFAQATTGATDTMRHIAADLLMMGLNAQVQALQAKNNCLEVLASEVSNISSEAGGLTLDFERKLSSTTETLTTFVRSSETFYTETQAQHQLLATRDGAVFADLRAEYDSSKALVTDVASSLQQLKQQADDLLASVDLADISRDALQQARVLFTELADVCAEVVSDEQPVDERVLSDVQSRYTMDSERAAHAAVLARSAPAVTAAAAVAVAETAPEPALASSPASGTGELGDNVELF